jgi:hypothetical protein
VNALSCMASALRITPASSPMSPGPMPETMGTVAAIAGGISTAGRIDSR